MQPAEVKEKSDKLDQTATAAAEKPAAQAEKSLISKTLSNIDAVNTAINPESYPLLKKAAGNVVKALDSSIQNPAAQKPTTAASDDAWAKEYSKNAEQQLSKNDPKEIARQKHLQELHDNRFEKKGARRAFHLVNFLGLHQIFNNVTSVIITFVMSTTDLADTMKNKMAYTPIGKGLSLILAAPGKAVNGMFKILGMDFDKEFRKLSPEAQKIELAFRADKGRRSAIEVAFMCFAGFVALAPVYFLEKHRAGFLNTVDNWLHPGRSKEEKKAAALTPEDEPKETLWNLFRARIIALAVVFGFDQTRDNIDNILKHRHKSLNKPGMYRNMDTVAGWGLGNKIYDKLPDGVRSWLTKVFSGKMSGDNIALRKIQHETRDDVLQAINAPEDIRLLGKKMTDLGEEIRKHHGDKVFADAKKAEMEVIDKQIRAQGGFKHVERAVFAEQARLFITKEVLLTTILSVVIYACAKSETAAKFFEKIGLQKKGTYDKEHAAIEARKKGHATPNEDKSKQEVAENEGKFTTTVGKREPVAAPATSFTEAAVSTQNKEVAASLA